MPALIISRKNEWMNRLRKIGVYLDGEKIGTVSNGETKEFQVSAGLHQLHTKIDWCGSRTIPFTIAENESKTFELSSFKKAVWLMPLVAVLLIVNYLLQVTFRINSTLWLLVPVFLIFIYFLTLGRKDYLELKEKN